MISCENRDYYAARAEQELERARTAHDANAARAHFLLARLYLNKLDGDAAAELNQAPPDRDGDSGC